MKSYISKNTIISLLILIIIVLGAIMIEPHTLQMTGSQPASNSSNQMMMPDAPAMTLKTFDIAGKQNLPTLTLNIQKDTMDGWDLHMITTNFTFTPEKINSDPIYGEGHVHLYVDGKLIVVLGSWYHLDDLTPGQHDIRVTLNNNDHSVYSINGVYIMSEKIITQ